MRASASPRRVARPAGARRPGEQDPTPLPPTRDRRPARDARRVRRLEGGPDGLKLDHPWPLGGWALRARAALARGADPSRARTREWWCRRPLWPPARIVCAPSRHETSTTGMAAWPQCSRDIRVPRRRTRNGFVTALPLLPERGEAHTPEQIPVLSTRVCDVRSLVRGRAVADVHQSLLARRERLGFGAATPLPSYRCPDKNTRPDPISTKRTRHCHRPFRGISTPATPTRNEWTCAFHASSSPVAGRLRSHTLSRWAWRMRRGPQRSAIGPPRLPPSRAVAASRPRDRANVHPSRRRAPSCRGLRARRSRSPTGSARGLVTSPSPTPAGRAAELRSPTGPGVATPAASTTAGSGLALETSTPSRGSTTPTRPIDPADCWTRVGKAVAVLLGCDPNGYPQDLVIYSGTREVLVTSLYTDDGRDETSVRTVVRKLRPLNAHAPWPLSRPQPLNCRDFQRIDPRYRRALPRPLRPRRRC